MMEAVVMAEVEMEVSGDGGGDGGGGDDGQGTRIQRVQFTNLIVLREEGNVALFWEAINEQDLTSYEIERSVDEEGYSALTTLSKGQTGAYAQSYTYSDTAIPSTAEEVSYRIKKYYVDSSTEYSDSRSLALDPEDVLEEPTTTFQISQNYPNPATSATVITYNVPESAGVTIKLYDMLGREVKTLVDRGRAPGTYQILLDTSDLKSGLYILLPLHSRKIRAD